MLLLTKENWEAEIHGYLIIAQFPQVFDLGENLGDRKIQMVSWGLQSW